MEEKKRFLRSVLGNGGLAGNFLDIGCGMGGYLIAANEMGFFVKGIEPSSDYSGPAWRLTRFEIVNDYYRPGLFAEKFDAVMVSHVIEHIYNPTKFVADVMSDTAPGGKVILITPNAGALSEKFTRQFWSMYKPVDHVTMLTKESLRRLCPPDAQVVDLHTAEWLRKSTLSPNFRRILGVVSLPMFAAGRWLDLQSCCVAVFRKAS